LGKHGVTSGALGYYLPARQFLPGALLINGMRILVWWARRALSGIEMRGFEMKEDRHALR
jgi:hypothetical protein